MKGRQKQANYFEIYLFIYLFLFITTYGIQNRSQRMKCKRVKDPILKQITNGAKIKNDAN